MRVSATLFGVAGSKPIPIRFDADVIRSLDAAALEFGTNRAALVRFLVETFLRQRDAGSIAYPPNWSALLAQHEREPGPREVPATVKRFTPAVQSPQTFNDAPSSAPVVIVPDTDRPHPSKAVSRRTLRRAQA